MIVINISHMQCVSKTTNKSEPTLEIIAVHGLDKGTDLPLVQERIFL